MLRALYLSPMAWRLSLDLHQPFNNNSSTWAEKQICIHITEEAPGAIEHCYTY